jgi:hypothetical protein
LAVQADIGPAMSGRYTLRVTGEAVVMAHRVGSRRFSALLAVAHIGCVSILEAQTCFFYSDNEDAPAPLVCVDQTGPSGACVTDGDCAFTEACVSGFCWETCNWPSDCTSIPADDPQTILEMHTQWHGCFGNTGGTSPPTGRGQRWYAFHRQFEVDFNRWRDGIGFSHIESLEWCPNMTMPEGHPSAQPGGIPGHPASCGNGLPRPDDVTCVDCVAFPQCLYYAGAGPMSCPSAPCGTCAITGCNGSIFSHCCSDSDCPSGQTCQTVVNFGHTALEDFPNVDEVSKLMDAYFHGGMHGAVGFGDGVHHCDGGTNDGDPCTNSTQCGGGTCRSYVDDAGNPNCSPRDPMFWRLHKALDDVVRAWQDHKAVDVMVVVDRSGSMSDPDSGGMSKLDAALEAVDMFADLLEHNRSDSQTNRIGVVSYSSGATLHMPLTVADSTLRDPGGPLDLALSAIAGLGPGGCTSIGGGIARALEELCPPSGDCQGFVAGGDNDRKAILVLTDGMENTPPCLNRIDAAPSGCYSECRSTSAADQLDFDELEFTQLVAVGFGQTGSLNGDLLTLVAERQGGIYMQNPNMPGDDLKDFFVKAFGNLTDEFLLFDPRGFLAASDPVSDPIEYTSCGDTKLTFASGWKTPVAPGELRLLINAPSGDLVRASDPRVQASTEETWDYARIVLPYNGESSGTWRAHLVRRHQLYMNGFTPDSFSAPDEGIAIVRRQIQRLCPDGCRSTLYYEAGRLGDTSAYEKALSLEQDAGLLGEVAAAGSAAAFTELLNSGPWELIVYSYTGRDEQQPYDSLLAGRICQGQRAILTDTRPSVDSNIFECAGVQHDDLTNWEYMTGDGRLVDGKIRMENPGHEVMTYGLIRLGANDVQATAIPVLSAAIVARAARGVEQYWFVDVLGRGLSKLDLHLIHSTWQSELGLMASVRMLPSYIPAGGFDNVNARVVVEYPLIGVGELVCEKGLGDQRDVQGEFLDPRAAAVAAFPIPTATATFPLYDDGTNGDQYAGNATWTSQLPGLPRNDGMYRFRYMFDLTIGGCTTHREFVQSVFVGMKASEKFTSIQVGASEPIGGGALLTPVRIFPEDVNGNCWGPGLPPRPVCEPSAVCRIDPQRGVTDHGDGSYTIPLVTLGDVACVQLSAFGALFDIDIPCPNCPRLESLTLDPATVPAHGTSTATIHLSGPAPDAPLGGLAIFVESQNPLLAEVPPMVIVPSGQSEASFSIPVHHAHDSNGEVSVAIRARCAGQFAAAVLTIVEGEPEVIIGDCDANLVIDLNDFRRFPPCVSGPDTHPDEHGECLCTDLDDDEDTDLFDYFLLQTFFGRPRPDLTVAGAACVPQTAVPGEALVMDALVKNLGNATARDVLVQACDGGGWCGEAVIAQVDGLSQARVEIPLVVEKQQMATNPHFFVVVVDPGERVPELDEDNNKLELLKPTFVVQPMLPQPQIEDEHDDVIVVVDGRTIDVSHTNYGEDGAPSENREIDDPDKFGPVEGTDKPEPLESGVPEQPRIDPGVRAADQNAQPGDRLQYVVKFDHPVPMPRLPDLDPREGRFSPKNTRFLEQRISVFEGVRRARMASADNLLGLIRQLDGRILEEYTLAGAVLVDAPKGLLARLEELQPVLHVEPVVGRERPPSHDGNANNDVDDGRARIDTDPYFNAGATGAGFIALLDSGVRSTHTLFNSPDHILFFEDCVNGNSACNDTGDSDYDPSDDCWNHGTSTAAIITGNGNLGNAFRGVTSAWLDAWKVYPEDCGSLNYTAVHRAYDQAVYWGDKIIVAEMQSGQGPTGSIAEDADDAYDAGSLTIAANGNNGADGAGSVNSPANAHKALGIGNYKVDTLAAIASQSLGPTSDNRYKPDIQAPSQSETASASSNTGLKNFGGTSGAAPYAAGATSVFIDWFNLTGLTSSNSGKAYAALINAGPNGWGSFSNTIGTGKFELPTNGNVYLGSRNVTLWDNDDVSFTVGAGADEIRAAIWWPEGTSQHNDIDLYLLRPDGSQAHHSISSPSVFEHVVVSNPSEAGTWRIRIYGYSVLPTFPFFSSQTVYYAIFVRN